MITNGIKTLTTALYDAKTNMKKIPDELISARNAADLAADVHLAVWDALPPAPSHEQIMEWIEAREKFQSLQTKYLLLVWKWQDL